MGITHPELARAWETAGILRGFHADLLGSLRDPKQALIAMVRYAVHTLSFDESDVRQKRWALYTAGQAARRLTDDLRRSVQLRVDWVDEPARDGSESRSCLDAAIAVGMPPLTSPV